MFQQRKFKICDPLYGYIYLEGDEGGLLNHPVFQRLRLIRQLGFSDKAFPSATHNRFTHSLGVSHLAGEAFDSIFEKNKKLLKGSKKKLFRKLVRMAALLHDIGHGPFSHSSERFMPSLSQLNLQKYLKNSDRAACHEDYTLKFIIQEDGLSKVLKEMGLEPYSLAQILHPDFLIETDDFKEGGLNFLPLLRQIIGSPFDVDRMDYLYRDSLFCGVKYGLIDFVWLVSHLDCHIKEDQVFLAIDSSALYTLESLILGRQHMRLIVYFHYKSAIYNQMLKFYSNDCDWTLPPHLPDYLQFTDIKLVEKLEADSNHWARRIIERKPYLRLYEAMDFVKENFFNLKDKVVSKKESAFGSTVQSDRDFSYLKEKLKREGLEFIVINSEEDSIKPSKSNPGKSPVFLKNKVFNQVQKWEETPNLLSIPSRKLRRIYVKPEDFSQAKKYLKRESA